VTQISSMPASLFASCQTKDKSLLAEEVNVEGKAVRLRKVSGVALLLGIHLRVRLLNHR
jgi:hypothetical protein